MEWFNQYAHTCEACKQLGNYAKHGAEACTNCRVELMEGNEDVANVYMLSRGQIITMHIGEKDIVYEISNQAIDAAMKWLKVKNKLECANRVRRLFFEFKDRENE